MAFPSSPTVGDIYSDSGFSWRWDGVAWSSYGSLQQALQRYNLTLNTNLTETTIALNSTIISIDSFVKTAYSTAEYTIQMKQGSSYRTSKILLVTDGTTVNHTEYAVLEVGTSIPVIITSEIIESNVILYASVTNAASSNVSVKAYRLAVTS
jgi:hypothetical protein